MLTPPEELQPQWPPNKQLLKLYSVYLLYKYKSANTGAGGAGGQAQQLCQQARQLSADNSELLDTGRYVCMCLIYLLYWDKSANTALSAGNSELMRAPSTGQGRGVLLLSLLAYYICTSRASKLRCSSSLYLLY